MSRTYRRRHARYNLDWVLSDYAWINGHLQRVGIDPRSREGKKVLARYFSDASFGDYAHAAPPHWYRRYLNHRADRREEAELQRWRRNPDREIVLPRRVSDAGWYW
ncbi:MAG: hypothetical protein LBF50_01235 [Azoarcus sp.]|jgi:hypothetical protein|nr:hypothetical protein [Azoarcus sp.]